MIIGLSGRAGVGKTTLANIAEQNYNFRRTSFAASLKSEVIAWMAEEGFEFTRENFFLDDNHKNALFEVPAHLNIPPAFLVHVHNLHGTYMSYRKIMQYYSDKRKEETGNKDYFISKFLNTTDFSVDLIIDDVRYAREAALVKALGGLLIRINREKEPHIPGTHSSETDLDNFPHFDSVITKYPGITLENFTAICHEHLKLWTGALDDTRPETTYTGEAVGTVAYPTRFQLPTRHKHT